MCEAVVAARGWGAGLLPTLKKPAEAVGLTLHVPGSFWARCPAADKAKICTCNVREFSAQPCPLESILSIISFSTHHRHI